MIITIEPVGFVKSSRKDAVDDGWSEIESYIELVAGLSEDSLLGLNEFSHVEIIYYFHLVDKSEIVVRAEHPRENSKWPKVGIFAQRKKSRPNLIGATISKIVKIDGRKIFIANFDGIDGTPVVDIKPVMKEYLPFEDVKQPDWSKELMKNYW